MVGELGIKIVNAVTQKREDMLRPFDRCPYRAEASIDLTLNGNKDEFLHICGDNDWGYIAVDILKPLLQEANKLYIEILNEIGKRKPDVILVGMNEFRLLDILHIARDGEYGISVIKNIPVVRGNFCNGIKYLGKNESDEYLPFT